MSDPRAGGHARPAEHIGVLVVGAGPAGLTAALTLAAGGAPPLLIDRRPAPGTERRAVWIQPGSLDAWDRLDVADAVVAAGQLVEGLEVRTTRRVVAWLPMADPGLSRFAPVALDQPVTEQLLLDRLAHLGGAVEWGWTLRSLLRLPGGGLKAVLHRVGQPAERVVHCHHLIGADGARSTVRDALGIPARRRTYRRELYVADLAAVVPHRRDAAHMLLTGEGAHVVLPLPDGRWRAVGTRARQGEVPGQVSEVVAALGGTLSAVERHATHRGHRLLARTFTADGVALVGDAAHLHSPVGGQGMNLAVADAAEIAAALQAILAGEAGPTALVKAGARRRRIAVGVLRTTDMAFRVQSAPGPIAAALRPLGFRTTAWAMRRSTPLHRAVIGRLSQTRP